MVKDLEIKKMNKEKVEDKESNKEKTLVEKVNEATEFIEKVKEGSIKRKELKIPRKAKVRKSKLKKGWVGIIRIDENGNISGEKQKIMDSTFKTKDGIYHSVNGGEIMMWEGKFPVIIQPANREEPYNPRENLTEVKQGEKKFYLSNNVNGQKYVMARMLKDAIKLKTKGNASSILWIIGIAVVGYIVYSLFTGGI